MVADGLDGMRNEPMPDILSEEANESIVGRATRRFEALNRVRRERLRNLKPWKEFFDASKFSTPTRGEIFSRLMHNMSYFNSNYVVVVALVTLYTLVTNLAFSLAMGSIVGFWLWYRTRNTPLYIGNTELSPFQVNAGLIVSGLIVFYATSGSSTIFWLVVLAGFAVVGHAVTRVPDTANNPMGDLMASMVPNIV